MSVLVQRDSGSLRQELMEAGVFGHRTLASLSKFLLLLGVGLSLWWIGLQLPLWATALLAVVASVPLVAAAMSGHEAAHGSFADQPWKNAALAHFAFPMLTGLGVQHWKHKHNVLHHGHPNVVGQDDDIDLWPMAMCEETYLASSPLRQWFQRNAQGVMFWPLTFTLAFVMRWETAKGNVRYLRKKGFDRALAADVTCQVLHYVLLLGLPILFFGLWPALIFYVVTWAVSGLLLTMIFIPAHVGLPLTTTQEKGWRHQVVTTRNLGMPGWLSWLFVGLDSQVEHHLFPRITHQNMAAARPIVRRFCESEGLPYQQTSYVSALRNSSAYMFVAWKTKAEAILDSSCSRMD